MNSLPHVVADQSHDRVVDGRVALKATARGIASCAVLPAVVSFRLRALIYGADRALEGSSQTLALVPGLLGQYLRRAFLARVLARFAPTATAEFGSLFSDTRAWIDEYVYIGPGCRLGFVHLEPKVLLAPNVQVPSGPKVHGVAEVNRAIVDQPGELECVTIGAGSWIGAGAIVMADVGRETVIAAGAVVTKPVPDRVVAGGVPAKVIRHREGPVLHE